MLKLVLIIFLGTTFALAQTTESVKDDNENDRKAICDEIKKTGVMGRADKCYTDKVPKAAKDITAICNEMIGAPKDKVVQVFKLFCGDTGKEVFAKHDACWDENLKKKGMKEEEADNLMMPFFECLFGKQNQ